MMKMKKVYCKPECQAYRMTTAQLLAGSGIEQDGTPGGGNHGGNSGNSLDIGIESAE